MAVTLKVTGLGEFQGSATNLESYSVNEDATPLVVSDTSGGTGGLQFTVVENDLTPLLLNDTVELTDDSNGTTTGTVSGMSGSLGVVNVTSDSRLNLFMANVSAAPFSGTVYNAFVYYLGLAGITTNYNIDNTLTSSVVFPGFQGTLWEYIKQLCAVTGTEIALVSNNVVVRKVRTRVAETRKQSEVGWAINNIDLAQNIEIYSYNSVYVNNGMIYPLNGTWTDEMQVYQVDAGKTVTFDIQVDASILSLEQPSVVASVPKTYSGPSVYAVAGKDGLPIQPQQWVDGGGKLTVEVLPDTQTIRIKITGARETRYAPYRIAMSSGPSDYYSSIRLRGTGVTYTKELFKIPTGVPASKTVQDVGVTVDSPFIQSDSVAFTQGMAVAQQYAAPRRTLTMSSPVVNRTGDKGSAIYPKFSDFNATYAGDTFAQFDAVWTGQTFDDFRADMYSEVQNEFENQSFGNVSGSRIRYRNAWYRTRSGTTTQAGITFSADADSTFADFNVEWTGKTFAQFDASSAAVGRTFADFTLGPLET